MKAEGAGAIILLAAVEQIDEGRAVTSGAPFRLKGDGPCCHEHGGSRRLAKQRTSRTGVGDKPLTTDLDGIEQPVIDQFVSLGPLDTIQFAKAADRVEHRLHCHRLLLAGEHQRATTDLRLGLF